MYSVKHDTRETNNLQPSVIVSQLPQFKYSNPALAAHDPPTEFCL